MAKNQKSYTPEFKQQMVDLSNGGGSRIHSWNVNMA